MSVSDVTVTVRYFAAARAATGVDEQSMTFPAAPPLTVRRVVEAAADEHGDDLAAVLVRCSYLRNAVAVHDLTTEIADGDSLDVLPPFAGG